MSAPENASLARRAARSSARVLVAQAVALFVSAGTLAYPGAWLYLGLQSATILGTNWYLLRTDPTLLERRMAHEERGETEPIHKLFFILLPILGLGTLLVAGLDRRFGWSHVPLFAVALGALIFCASGALVFWVLRENSFASSVIEVSAHQQVISTGPYRWVRHPMYTGFVGMIAATPLLLGSRWSALLVAPAVAIFVMRLRAEERFLLEALPGYRAYTQMTRRRLVPGFW